MKAFAALSMAAALAACDKEPNAEPKQPASAPHSEVQKTDPKITEIQAEQVTEVQAIEQGLNIVMSDNTGETLPSLQAFCEPVDTIYPQIIEDQKLSCSVIDNLNLRGQLELLIVDEATREELMSRWRNDSEFELALRQNINAKIALLSDPEYLREAE
ncbi:MAG: hypothetical protein AAB373_01165 [Patescibacteria group bacterium]